MTSVAITPRSFRRVGGRHLALLASSGAEARYPEEGRTLDEEAMVAFVRGCGALIVGLDPVSEAVLRSGPLRLVIKYGSGLDNIDLAAADRLGARVIATPGANSRSVAELSVALMFALARHLVPHHLGMVEGTRQRITGVELAERQLGVIGYGNVGRLVAGMATCLGVRVVVHDPHVMVTDATAVSFVEALASDIVSLHLPLQASTRHLMTRDALAAMPMGALLVNTSRPDIVDVEALAEALESTRLGGAAFDDLGADAALNARLFATGRFLATPHSGAATVEAIGRTALSAVEALIEHRSLWQDVAAPGTDDG